MTKTLNPLAVDEKEAARMTGMAVSTLQKARRYGGGPPYVKLGRTIRYRVCDLEEFLEERVVSQ